MTRKTLTLVPLFLLSLSGCQRREDSLTAEEAAQASEELQVGSTAESLSGQAIEVGTHFTIGGAVEAAANDVKAFVNSQMACADVTLSGHTLTIEYGAHDVCLWNGKTITGTHEITVTKTDASEVVVDHVWTNLSNGTHELSGTAHVTWNSADPSRHVQHDLTWTRLRDGRTGHGTGDRVQKPLNGDLTVGFTETGDRTWDGARGHWALGIDDLEMRWVDPIPQAGTLTLETPFDKTVTVAFERKDADTIAMTFHGPRGSITIDVNKL
ncbi:MAG TPA: hypothetical protein VHE30_19380 [Polyangiaceae bacterium]|nr:hypothetical protein [Polyangiaceae bacterium]